MHVVFVRAGRMCACAEKGEEGCVMLGLTTRAFQHTQYESKKKPKLPVSPAL